MAVRMGRMGKGGRKAPAVTGRMRQPRPWAPVAPFPGLGVVCSKGETTSGCGWLVGTPSRCGQGKVWELKATQTPGDNLSEKIAKAEAFAMQEKTDPQPHIYR